MSESENERESDQLMDWQRFRQVSVLHYLLSIVLYVARAHIVYENTFYIIQTSPCATLFTPYSTVCTYSMSKRERESKRERVARSVCRQTHRERKEEGPACWLCSRRAHLIVENNWQPVALCFGVVDLQLGFVRLRGRRHLSLSRSMRRV